MFREENMQLNIEYLDIAHLTPYEKNARKHKNLDVDNIARSIEKYGFNDPIGIWSEKNIIVEGHGRLLAAKKLKMKTVPVVRLDHMTDDQRREYAIAHNATAELSEWDLDILPEELAELDLSAFDFDFGVSLDEDDTETKEREEIALNESVSVVVECSDDEEAETIFEKLSEEGYKCHISTL
jgi:hypothetical protein